MLIITKKVEKYWLITTEEKLVPIMWCPRDFFDFEIGALAFHLQSYTYLKEITFVLLLHAVDRDEFRKGGTFPYDDDTDVSQEQNKCCSMRWIDLFTELVLQQILKIDSADHLFLRKKKKTSARHPSKITISGVSPPCILLLPGLDSRSSR